MGKFSNLQHTSGYKRPKSPPPPPTPGLKTVADLNRGVDKEIMVSNSCGLTLYFFNRLSGFCETHGSRRLAGLFVSGICVSGLVSV